MADPYLDSGESFIITTHRISAGFAQHDLMLTTRNLVLVDRSASRFSPEKIPLASILTVTAGRVETGEPVIVLTFSGTAELPARAPLNLLFAQQPGEQRKHERDTWVKRLMEQVVAAKEGPAQPPVPAAGREEIRPPAALLRPIETARPHSSIVTTEQPTVAIGIIPEEPGEVPGEPAGAGSPGSGQETGVATPPEPDAADTDLPAGRGTAAPVDELPGAREEDLFEQRPSGPGMVPDESTDPFAEAVRVMREQERVHEEPPAAAPESPIVHPDTPVIPKTKPGILTRLSGIAGLLRGKTRPEITETARQEPEVPEGAGDVAGAGAFSESAEPMPAGEDQPPGEIVPASPMEGEPAAGEDHEAPGPAVAPEPPLSAEEAPSSGTGAGIPAGGAGEDLQVPEVPPAGVDAAPPDGPHVRPVLPAAPLVLALCATAAIILILIIGGIGSHQPGPGPSPAIPPTAGTPQTPGTTPATPTPMLTQAPTPATVPGPVPGEGVWVRVTCNGSFVGYVGNPGALRHVGGSGEQLYGITDRGGLVQASFTKQEYSGETLSVTVYRDGAAIFTRSVRAPGGSLDFIIDPATGGFPGGIPTPTSATGLTPGKTY